MKFFTRGRYTYKNPERVANDYASRMHRVVEKELQRERELQDRHGRLSPVNKIHFDLLKETEVRLRRALDERRAIAKVVKKQAGKNVFLGRLLSKAVMSGTLQRERDRRAQTTIGAAKVSAADNREFHAVPKEVRNPRTVFGTDAHLSINSFGRHEFRLPYLVVPCIQRAIRREVMFAKKKGGKGYRKPHRLNPNSMIWC